MDKKETIISTIVQAIVAINMVLMAFGITTFESLTADIIYPIVSVIAMIVAWGYGLWTNHNFTNDMVLSTKLGRKSKKKKKKGDLTVFDRMGGVLYDD